MSRNVPKIAWAYRITHIQNLEDILDKGICNKNHPDFNEKYVNIGNRSIIGARNIEPVKIEGYGNIGEYVPFYFTPKSMMLYNILTGYGVDKVAPKDIIFLVTDPVTIIDNGCQYFFTDGQANTRISNHYDDIKDLDKIDWGVVNSGDFKKSDADPDRTRKYQAEFLVHKRVPVECIKAIVVYNESCATFVKSVLAKTSYIIPIYIKKVFYFNR